MDFNQDIFRRLLYMQLNKNVIQMFLNNILVDDRTWKGQSNHILSSKIHRWAIIYYAIFYNHVNIFMFPILLLSIDFLTKFLFLIGKAVSYPGLPMNVLLSFWKNLDTSLISPFLPSPSPRPFFNISFV